MADAAAPGAVADAWRSGIDDRDIVEQQERIRREIEETQPLVGEPEDPACLIEEYMDNPVFLVKIGSLVARYRQIRRCRGDGSCFYRATLVKLGEMFAGKAAYAQVVSRVRAAQPLLLALGYPDSTTPDFIEALEGYLEGLAEPGAAVESHALAPLREGDPMRAAFILYGLRLLACVELRTREDEYLPYVLGTTSCATLADFCATEVETPQGDADNIAITALARALGIQLRIAYLDATPGEEATEVVLPGEGAPADALVVDILYRPGHFDCCYRK